MRKLDEQVLHKDIKYPTRYTLSGTDKLAILFSTILLASLIGLILWAFL